MAYPKNGQKGNYHGTPRSTHRVRRYVCCPDKTCTNHRGDPSWIYVDRLEKEPYCRECGRSWTDAAPANASTKSATSGASQQPSRAVNQFLKHHYDLCKQKGPDDKEAAQMLIELRKLDPSLGEPAPAVAAKEPTLQQRFQEATQQYTAKTKLYERQLNRVTSLADQLAKAKEQLANTTIEVEEANQLSEKLKREMQNQGFGAAPAAGLQPELVDHLEQQDKAKYDDLAKQLQELATKAVDCKKKKEEAAKAEAAQKQAEEKEKEAASKPAEEAAIQPPKPPADEPAAMDEDGGAPDPDAERTKAERRKAHADEATERANEIKKARHGNATQLG